MNRRNFVKYGNNSEKSLECHLSQLPKKDMKRNFICLEQFDKVLRQITMLNSMFMQTALSHIVLYIYTFMNMN